MLFAAGFGTRMGELTKDRPKPLIKVAGKPLIDHALDLVEKSGERNTVVNVHYLADQIEAHLSGRDITLSFETPDILDTGGGLRHAMPFLGDAPVFTMNTDAVWSGPNPLLHLAKKWRPEVMDALLLCIPRANAWGHKGQGDFISDTHGKGARGPGSVYSGLQIVKTNQLSQIEQTAFSLNLLWDRMLQDNSLYIDEYPGSWCDVGSAEGIQEAETMLAHGNV